MTKTFTTNKSNDLYIAADGNLAISTGVEAVKQACQTAVKAQLHEMTYEYDSGMPDFTAVWVGAPNYGQYRAALTLTLSNVDGVLSVDSVLISQKENTLKYQAAITTQYGSAVLNG
jgi:hypothetical protein